MVPFVGRILFFTLSMLITHLLSALTLAHLLLDERKSIIAMGLVPLVGRILIFTLSMLITFLLRALTLACLLLDEGKSSRATYRT